MSINRHRFNKRIDQLNEGAQLIEDLARMPDRATEKDFRQASDLMRGAASDLVELVKAPLMGCVCQRVENDNYSYLDYAESCVHHRQLYALREKLREDYAKMEKELKNEVRMKLVVAALSGTAVPLDSRDTPTAGSALVVARALAIADEALRQITEIA